MGLINFVPYHTQIDFLKSFPTGGLAVEVGVLYGVNALNIHTYLQPDHLILIDAWEHCYDLTTCEKLDGDIVFQRCKNRFSNKFNVEFWRGKSKDKIPELKDTSVNFAYIDACHFYEECLADLEAMYPKMAPDSWICGHDFCEIVQFGVVRAVSVFIDRHNLKLDKLTDFPLGNVIGSDRKFYSLQTSYNSYAIHIP